MKKFTYPVHIEVFTEPLNKNKLNKSDIWVERRNFYCGKGKGRKKKVKVKESEDSELNKSSIWVESGDIYGDGEESNTESLVNAKSISDEKQKEDESYLIIGFDSEFQTPSKPVSGKEVREGKAKYQVLSYQFHAKTRSGVSWSGICCPKSEDVEGRMTLGEFIIFALGTGLKEKKVSKVPTRIYLVGHFTRADIPAFKDFAKLSELFSNIRNTFASIDNNLKIHLDFKDGEEPLMLQLYLRDTTLLSPTGYNRLAALGDIIGLDKLVLDEDPKKELAIKQNMARFRSSNWPLFKEYAIRDAVICVEYIERIIARYQEVTGKKKVPTTLTSIGVDLLQKIWTDDMDESPLDLVGKEVVEIEEYSKKRGYFIKKLESVDIEELSWFKTFVSETYHGGRNEQFWFGPGFHDEWKDYDLSSAYPVGMSLIQQPHWHDIYTSNNLDDYSPTALGFACVDFDFGNNERAKKKQPLVRFPVLPVRTQNGLIFPNKGRSYCSAPEIALARSLGASLKIRFGVIVPAEQDRPVFRPFIRKCLYERLKYKGKEGQKLDELFWKELSNSTYGKTAQGLKEKRVYDMRAQETRILPPSKITNPFYASYITSFVRATLGEIMNALPASVCVFSCTTDGFLTSASSEQIQKATEGPLAQMFSQTRKALMGEEGVLEVKHNIKRPLGWRTRGQATLEPGVFDPKKPDAHILLAKSSINTPTTCETDELENEFVVKLFFDRTPSTQIWDTPKTGLRDIVEFNADLVEKERYRRLNMEYDWKRRPFASGISKKYKHILWNTLPWNSKTEFTKVRSFWQEYIKTKNRIIKNDKLLNSFATFAETKLMLQKDKQKYLRKTNSDLSRLRLALCSAWKQKQAGLISTKDLDAKGFAALLSKCGVFCKRNHVEYGFRKPFVSNSVPPTQKVLTALKRLKNHFPQIDKDSILSQEELMVSLRPQSADRCPFVLRAVEG